MKIKIIGAALLFFFLLFFLPLLAQDSFLTEKISLAGKSQLISLDAKDMNMEDIARMFSHVSGLNVIVSDDVKAKVTMRVVDVPWRNALNLILKTNNLATVTEGNFLRILTYNQLKREEEGVPLVNKVVFLNFAKSDRIIAALTQISSRRGKITSHFQTNSLIITEIPDTLKKMEEIIKKLDKRIPQVMIEALMVDVKLTKEDQLGIDWSITDKDRQERTMHQHLQTGQTAGIIQYGKTIFPQADFILLIDMWCQESKAEVLANPKVMTMDGLKANIELVEEIPYTKSEISTDSGSITTTVSFREAGIKLDVIPHINNEGFISLNLKTEQSFRSGTVGGQPIIDKRTAETNLLVADGETIVIGGLRKRDSTDTIDRLPIVSKIPILGRLFQKKVKISTDSELLIFVTPFIITEAKLSQYETEKLEKFANLRGEKNLSSFDAKESQPSLGGMESLFFLKKKQAFPLRLPK